MCLHQDYTHRQQAVKFVWSFKTPFICFLYTADHQHGQLRRMKEIIHRGYHFQDHSWLSASMSIRQILKIRILQECLCLLLESSHYLQHLTWHFRSPKSPEVRNIEASFLTTANYSDEVLWWGRLEAVGGHLPGTDAQAQFEISILSIRELCTLWPPTGMNNSCK